MPSQQTIKTQDVFIRLLTEHLFHTFADRQRSNSSLSRLEKDIERIFITKKEKNSSENILKIKVIYQEEILRDL